MYHEHVFLDAAGDTTPWLNVHGVDTITLHIRDVEAGDTFRIWGTLFENVGQVGSHPVSGAIEVETALTGSTEYLIPVTAFSGMLAVELDVDGGVNVIRTVRIQGVTRASRG